MPDYTQPRLVEKRLRYFDGLFLKDQDFVDEQKYHLNRQRLHNGLLHSAGVAEGLDVSVPAGRTVVNVSPGVAVDHQGRQIVLLQPQVIDLTGRQNQRVLVYVGYEEVPVDRPTTGGNQEARWLERAVLEAVTEGQAPKTPDAVVLERLAVDAQGRVTVDGGVRVFAGLRLPDGTAASWTMSAGAVGRADLSGGLRVNGDIGIGTVPTARLHLHGAAQGHGIAFTNEANTAGKRGYRIAFDNDALRFQRADDSGRFAANQLVIQQDTGSVGVGTGTPRARLEVAGGAIAGSVSLGGPVPGLSYQFDYESVGVANIGHNLRLQSPNHILLQTGGAAPLPRVMVTNTGRVGIGTTNPISQLQIKTRTTIDEGPAGASNFGCNAYFDGTWRRVDESKAGLSVHINADDAAGQELRVLRMETNGTFSNIAVLGSGTSFIRSGFLAIGTVTPEARLHVEDGEVLVRATAPNNLTQSLTAVRLANYGGQGTWLTWGLHTASIAGGGPGVAPNAFEIWEYPASARRLQIRPGGDTSLVPVAGSLGVGTTTPNAKLSVVAAGAAEIAGNAHSATFRTASGSLPVGVNSELSLASFGFHSGNNTSLGIRAIRTVGTDGWPNTAIGLGMDVDNTVRAGAALYLHANGGVGVGTRQPAARFHVAANANVMNIEGTDHCYIQWYPRGVAAGRRAYLGFGTGTDHSFTLSNESVNAGVNVGRVHIHANEGLYLLGHQGTWISRGWGGSGNLTVEGDTFLSGRLGVFGQSPQPRTVGWGGGIHTFDIECEGSGWARGGWASGPRDVAENYESQQVLEAGEVACFDRDQDVVVRSSEPNDALVCGVVSSKPGLLLNSDPDEHAAPDRHLVPIALCGRVPCLVVDENGPIRRGDLLTSSSTPGCAMRAKPVTVDGKDVYQAGSILGKALEPLVGGRGTIEMFVAFA